MKKQSLLFRLAAFLLGPGPIGPSLLFKVVIVVLFGVFFYYLADSALKRFFEEPGFDTLAEFLISILLIAMVLYELPMLWQSLGILYILFAFSVIVAVLVGQGVDRFCRRYYSFLPTWYRFIVSVVFSCLGFLASWFIAMLVFIIIGIIFGW